MTDENMDKRLNEEVGFHIDMQTERFVRMGFGPQEARRQAMLQFGGRDRYTEEARAQFQSHPLAGILAELRVAGRTLLHQRAFALTTIVTLALGIGAVTSIFSVVNAVLLRPLPYADANRLALIWTDMRARNVSDFPLSPPDYREIKQRSTTFEDIATISPGNRALIVDGQAPEQVTTLGVTPNLLTVLGARVAHGRGFIDDDATPFIPPPQTGAPGAPATAPAQPLPRPPVMLMLSDAYWHRRFAGDTNVIGKTVDLGGQAGTIVGVLAPEFEMLFPPNTNIESHPDMLAVQRINYETSSRINVFMRLVGKLKPGATVAAANQDLERISADLRSRFPIMKTADSHFRVEAMHDDLVKDVRPAIVALMGAVVFVLLIACANIINLLLVRAVARERELAVRVAIGSSQWRLARQVLVESGVLAVAGTIAGVALAWAGVRLLVALAPANLPRLDDVAIDPIVLGFATVAALVAMLLVGLVPAIRASRVDIAGVLRAGGRTPSLTGASLLRNGVVVAEVALSVVLLIGGGLMTRSFIELMQTRPGFDPGGALTFSIGGRVGQDGDDTRAAIQTLHDRFAALPGVEAVTAVTPLPLDGQLVNARWGPEEAVTDATKFRQANLHIVLPGYFEAMHTRVIAGRAFDASDNDEHVLHVVIDDVLAAKAFPGVSPIGKRLYARTRGQEPEWLEVIGVVEHQRHESLTVEGREAIFLTDGFFGHGAVGTWVVRVACVAGRPCDPTSLSNSVRSIVTELAPRAPVAKLQTLQAVVERAMTPTRFALVLIGVFAVVAAGLACVGLYGVLSTAVRQRTAEIGVRMAFGASARSVFGLVVGDGLRLSGLGLGIGLVGAFFLTRAMTTMLVGVRPTDPITYAAIVVLFVGIAVVACLIPARRAARLDPADVLRQ